jgi:hypothetical protein
MAEQEEVYSSKIKYDGVFSFKDLYKFCYDWLDQEVGLSVAEGKYAEKVSGTSKNIDVEWEGSKKISDYFQFKAKVKFKILALSKVEMNQGGAKISTNKGSVEIGCKGMLVRDYDGKFETTAFKKFMRSVYEKWIIPSRVDQFQDKIIGNCDEFLSQSKAYLDLEGKR